MSSKATPVDSEKIMFKRKLCIGACTAGLPLFYMVKNRNNIYKSTQIMREFYLKELVARSVLGFFVGVGVSIYFYGAGPVSKPAEGELKDGKAEVNGRQVDQQSLEYSVAQKKKFLRKGDFLPGKIRDD